MRRFLTLFVVLHLLAAVVWADKNEAGSGIVYGKGHAYYIKAPKGWIFDNESGAAQGVYAVIYPRGSNWRDSKAVIYSGATSKEGGDLMSVIADDLAEFRKKSPSVEMLPAPDLTTADGKTAVVRQFRGDKWGNVELVAYIDTPTVVCEVILSARDVTSFEAGRGAFESVVRSFKFANLEPKPEPETRSDGPL